MEVIGVVHFDSIIILSDCRPGPHRLFRVNQLTFATVRLLGSQSWEMMEMMEMMDMQQRRFGRISGISGITVLTVDKGKSFCTWEEHQ